MSHDAFDDETMSVCVWFHSYRARRDAKWLSRKKKLRALRASWTSPMSGGPKPPCLDEERRSLTTGRVDGGGAIGVRGA
jgi:hypothetical protein